MYTHIMLATTVQKQWRKKPFEYYVGSQWNKWHCPPPSHSAVTYKASSTHPHAREQH